MTFGTTLVVGSFTKLYRPPTLFKDSGVINSLDVSRHACGSSLVRLDRRMPFWFPDV